MKIQVSLNDGVQFGTLTLMAMDDIMKRPIAQIRYVLQQWTPQDRTKFVKRVLNDWDEDNGPGRLRKVAAKLLPLTVAEQLLHHLHPGSCTLYRGGRQFKTNLVVSWSKDRDYANGYGKPLVEKKLTINMPALELDRCIDPDMKEVITFQND